MHNIISEMSIYALVHGAARQYTYGFLKLQRNGFIILAFKLTSSDALALYYVTWVK